MRWIHRHFRALWEPFIQSLCKRIHKSKFSEQLNGWCCTNWYQIAPIKSNWIKIKTCELLCNGCPQLDDVLFTSRCQHIVAGVESDGEDWLCVSTQDKKRLVDRNFVALMTLWQSPDVEIVVSRFPVCPTRSRHWKNRDCWRLAVKHFSLNDETLRVEPREAAIVVHDAATALALALDVLFFFDATTATLKYSKFICYPSKWDSTTIV